MIQLKRYEFTCPFCNRNQVTFITDEKLQEVRKREKIIKEIFSQLVFVA